MSEEQLKAFLEKDKGDTNLQEKLKAAGDADAVVVIAKEAGFNISAENLSKAQSLVEDAELEDAAGGAYTKKTCYGGALALETVWVPCPYKSPSSGITE